MAKLYQYAVIFTPVQTKEQMDGGVKAKSELVVALTTLLANDERSALLLAARAIPEKYADQLDQLEIALRPF